MTTPRQKEFRGHGFSLLVPDHWEDISQYSLSGPVERGHRHGVWIVVEDASWAESARDFANRKLQSVLEGVPGSDRLQLSPYKFERGLEGMAADIRWQPLTDHAFFDRRFYTVLPDKTGFELTARFTKSSKATLGPAVQRMLGRLCPKGVPIGKIAAESDGFLWETERFSLLVDPGWADVSVYGVAEPEQGRFRRNVLVERRPIAPGVAVETLSDREMEELAALPGATILDRGGAAVRDGQPGFRCVLRRITERGGAILQTSLFAVRGETLFQLTFTFEEAMAPALRSELERLPLTFASGGRTSPAAAS